MFLININDCCLNSLFIQIIKVTLNHFSTSSREAGQPGKKENITPQIFSPRLIKAKQPIRMYRLHQKLFTSFSSKVFCAAKAASHGGTFWKTFVSTAPIFSSTKLPSTFKLLSSGDSLTLSASRLACVWWLCLWRLPLTHTCGHGDLGDARHARRPSTNVQVILHFPFVCKML